MFNTIYIPVDNSEYSNEAVRVGVKIGSLFKSKVVGSHVYAAAMHDYRFKQMEFTLPQEYLQEEEIERQRKIHDSLITMGLELISDCYLNPVDSACKEAGLPFERRMMDGKHHAEIIKDIESCAYDLTVLGVLGMGKTKDSQIGSVCERVTRLAGKDVLVVKHLPKDDEPERDTILVGVDGSPQSFGALMTGIELAKKLDKKLELISVYDPYLHYAVFKSIVEVLTDKAAKVFRFEEQNQLHEEIIDTGLAQIYQSHLNVAEKIALDHGVQVTKTLLDGKAFQKILNHVRNSNPWLVIIGRIGVHSPKEEKSLGSNAENLLRLVPSNILLCSRLEYPELDLKAEESILWTDEANERMKRVPDMVRGIARTAILRMAIEEGHSVITDSLILQAMDRFMPKKSAELTTQLAESLAIQHARNNSLSICTKCGVTSTVENPVKCGVCGASAFQPISQETVEKIAASQGGIEEEETYDGKTLGWSKEAREDLNSIEDKYQRRRAKARIEKAARTRKLTVVTKEFAQGVIDEEIGRERPTESAPTNPEIASNGALAGVKPLVKADLQADLKVVGKDQNGIELRSVFEWAPDALSRVLQIPAGFMREKTQERVERVALETGRTMIEMDLVEEGLAIGRKMMEQFLAASAPQSAAAPVQQSAEKKCPFSSMLGEDQNMGEAIKKVFESYGEKPIERDLSSGTKYPGEGKTPSTVYGGPTKSALNESGIMTAFEKRREDLKG